MAKWSERKAGGFHHMPNDQHLLGLLSRSVVLRQTPALTVSPIGVRRKLGFAQRILVNINPLRWVR